MISQRDSSSPPFGCIQSGKFLSYSSKIAFIDDVYYNNILETFDESQASIKVNGQTYTHLLYQQGTGNSGTSGNIIHDDTALGPGFIISGPAGKSPHFICYYIQINNGVLTTVAIQTQDWGQAYCPKSPVSMTRLSCNAGTDQKFGFFVINGTVVCTYNNEGVAPAPPSAPFGASNSNSPQKNHKNNPPPPSNGVENLFTSPIALVVMIIGVVILQLILY